MKKILFTICSLTLVTIVFAQREREEEEKGLGFRKENVFIGEVLI